MPKREKLLAELKNEQDVGVLLMAQMDGVPETIQTVISTTQYDEKTKSLRDKGHYVIRSLGVREHRLSVGLFGKLHFLDDHPLLHQYNTTPAALFFRGKPENANELLLDIMQTHASTFGHWRQFPQYLNVGQPLLSLLNSGGGLLGEMPRPLADKLVKVLEHHQLEHKLVKGEGLDKDEHGRSQLHNVLLIDDSYIIALDFSVDELGKV